jgi:ATP-binding cassette subfamily F protein uup
MNIVSVENVTKSYGEKNLFGNVSLYIDDNDKIGLIGLNGTGKTTLLNLIAGKDLPDIGTINISREITIEYLPQNPEFDPEATVLEQVLRGDSPAMQAVREYEKSLADLASQPDDPVLQEKLLQATTDINASDGWQLEIQVKTILTQLGIRDFASRMETLSGGQKKRVALASALIAPCNLLILDEPTNHMDDDMVEWLEKYLADRKGALLMITHDRYFLERVVHRIIELDNGKLYTYPGNFGLFVEKKAERKAIQSALEAKRQSLYKKELEWMLTGARARTTKQKARIQRFEELKESRSKVDDAQINISVAHSRLGKKIIAVHNISKSFGENHLIQDFSYTLLRDDRIGIIGPNGAGKSTLLNILAGKLAPDSGSIETGTTVKIACLSQESAEMDPNLRAIEYIQETAGYVSTAEGREISATQMMDRFLFPKDLQWTPIAKLSGGEKRRLYLLKVLMDAPNVLLLDEPTNDLDIDTLTALESYIEEFKGAVISVSHDRYFLDKTCHTILSFAGQGRIIEHAGNYSDFYDGQKTVAATAQREKAAKNNKPKKSARSQQPKLKFTFKEQLEYDRVDDEIAVLEDDISRIDEEMSRAASDFVKLQELMQVKDKLEEELLYKLERQEYLSNLEKRIKNQSPS